MWAVGHNTCIVVRRLFGLSGRPPGTLGMCGAHQQARAPSLLPRVGLVAQPTWGFLCGWHSGASPTRGPQDLKVNRRRARCF